MSRALVLALPAAWMLLFFAAPFAIVLSIGFAALWPGTRRLAGLAFAALCLAYLPLHLWDFVRPDPMFAPVGAALVRVVVQLLFIGAGWQLARRTALPARSS